MHPQLLNREVVTEYLTWEARWADSHGAGEDYLGLGLLYYAVVYTLRARVAVCLGSGGGFVPRLMRQAQRDLGMAGSSRTILVDGNVPGAGWGSPEWLDDGSFFRRQFPDVEIVLDLTRDAARNFFAEHSIQIDYLHIDADHSFAGCLEDFETYRRFLHEGSVVTLHDTNFTGAGVREVVEHIRTLPDCDVVNFQDMGEGTALVRIGKSGGGPPSGHAPEPRAAGGHLVTATRRPDARPVPPAEKDWKYLESRAFATRYVLAAHFVGGCRSVIEVGGAKTPIHHFLDGTQESVLVLDPFIRESRADTLRGRTCAVSHVRARFQDVDWHIPAGAEYGLVMLGLEIQGMEAHHYEVLYQLVNGAKVTVVEFPPSWEPSREQFRLIRDNTRTEVTFRMRLDLEGNDFGDLGNSWPPRCDREIYVLEPCR